MLAIARELFALIRGVLTRLSGAGKNAQPLSLSKPFDRLGLNRSWYNKEPEQ
jgi:hypothetical protein